VVGQTPNIRRHSHPIDSGPVSGNTLPVSDQPDYSLSLTLRKALGSELNRLEDRWKNLGWVEPIPNRRDDIDELLGHSSPASLVVVMAKPRFDHDTLSSRLIHRVGITLERPVVVFSDGGQVDIAERLIAIDSCVEPWRLQCGSIDEGGWSKVGQSITRIANSPIYLEDIPWDEPSELQIRVRDLAARSGLGLIVVDSLERLAGEVEDPIRRKQVAGLWRSIKTSARDLNVHIVVLRSPLRHNVNVHSEADGVSEKPRS
jgi:replicative DNA helicase